MFDYFYGQSGEMFSYFRVPKILFRDIKFKDLSTDAKTLYGILLDRMGLSVKNGWLDEQGRVYIIFPVQEVMDALGCADNKATKLFRELEKFGLIERKRRGLGKPNLIYVKNFADPRFRNREKNGSGAADSAQPETAKSRGNKTEWNKTEGSEPDPFPSDAEGEPDERTRLEAYFMQSLEVDLLLRVCPDEEETIHQIVNLLVDTCSSKRRMLRVAGDDKPAEVVRSRCMKLNADHIRFVLKCLAESTAPVRNMKQYLLAALYNAPTTMRYLEKQNIAPSIDNYEILYRGNLPTGKRSVPQAELLEQLYQKFNCAQPMDYHGHSMSVSDVILLNQAGKISAHYVDSIGFRELSGFRDKQERSSVLSQLKAKCDMPECNPTKYRKGRNDHAI